ATPATAAESLRAIGALVDAVMREARATVVGAGVSFGGQVRDGLVRRSVQVSGWEGVALGPLLEQRLAAPVLVANDANAGALGEWHDARRPAAPVCYLTVSTGIGGGLVLDGEILEGVDGLAGEVGHLIVEPGGA